ncbi:MAG: hypothetical protein FWG31_09190 [Oscillospiraceae bacterium]|nr:hypothetical protein [Oscillospiraceae bacterium]
MPVEQWVERCKAQRVHFLEGEIPPRFNCYGFVFARDSKGVYPIGAFEQCGDATIYPPQTLNPTEDGAMLAAGTGMARLWDGQGVLTVRFAKLRDGADFALSDVEEEMSEEAKNLLILRGLWDGEGASFLKPDENPPELLELTVIGVSAGSELYTAETLRGALAQLPDAVRAGFVGWYDKVLRNDG